MNKIVDYRPTVDDNVRIAFLNEIKKTCEMVNVILLNNDLDRKFEDVYEAFRYFARLNATGRVRITFLGEDKVLVSMKAGDDLIVPGGVDITLDSIFFHLKDGTYVEKKLEVYVLE